MALHALANEVCVQVCVHVCVGEVGLNEFIHVCMCVEEEQCEGVCAHVGEGVP